MAIGGLVVLFLVAIFFGYLSALGSPLLAAPFIGVGGIVILMTISPMWLAASTYFLTFFVVGAITYFLHFEKANWIPYMMGLVMYLHVFGLLLVMKRSHGATLPGFAWAVLAFFGAFALSVIANEVSPGQLLIAMKNYLFLWGGMFLFIFGVKDPIAFIRMWKAAFALAVVQVPVSIYQYAIVGGHQKETIGIRSWDVVSGTFGGGEFGGASGSLAIVMILVLLLSFALYRVRRMTLTWTLAIAGSALITLMLAEVKAAIIFFLPVGFWFFFREDLYRRPGRFLGIAALVLGVGALIMFSYQKLHYSGEGYEQSTVEKIEQALDRELDPAFVSLETGEMGRLALMVFWWRENLSGDPLAVAVGHGPGATRVSSFYLGDLVLRYPYFRLDRHAASILLWDSGVLGFGVFMLILFSGFRYSERMAADGGVPEGHRVFLRTGSVALVLVAASVFYLPVAIDTAIIQLLIVLCLGQAGYWHRRLQIERVASAPNEWCPESLGRQRQRPNLAPPGLVQHSTPTAL